MADPKLTIHTSPRGLERVVVHTDSDEPADAGLALFHRILPTLAELDRCARLGRGGKAEVPDRARRGHQSA